MTTTVVLLRNVPGENGKPWKAGDTKTCSDDFADMLIGRGDAYDASGARKDVGPVSGAGIRRGQTLKSCWQGKMISLATAGANHTSIYYRTLEAHTDRIRIGILNPVAAILTNVKVNVGTSNTLPGLNAALGGSSTNISGGTQVTSAAFDVAAGVSADAPGLTWSPWIDISTIDRIDGGTLPLVRILVEIPGASNANRPALSVARSRSGWENPANVGGRVMKCRSEAQLGATTPGVLGSTAYADDTMPIIVEYAPRVGQGLTSTHFGDSLQEAVDSDIEGYGWQYMARERVSTLTSPVEICNLAAASTTTTEFRARAEQLLPLLAPELVVCAVFTPNGIVAPNFTDTGNARLMYRNTQAIKAACAAVNATFVGWSGVPMLAVAPDITTGYKDLNAAGATSLNAYMAAVLSTSPVINAYGPLSGAADADGQVTLKTGSAAGNLHINASGHNLAAAPFETFLRANLPR
ncbi:hypothetical protein [Roseateles cavernae]|uniref:hypothetical protein n=1 Tax=Roseateles cavernae TaxID=3153578 RepID=UPI0032E4FE2D